MTRRWMRSSQTRVDQPRDDDPPLRPELPCPRPPCPPREPLLPADEERRGGPPDGRASPRVAADGPLAGGGRGGGVLLPEVAPPFRRSALALARARSSAFRLRIAAMRSPIGTSKRSAGRCL